jgi:hypothetical protein
VVGKLKRKRKLGIPRHIWEDYIRMDLRETGWDASGSAETSDGLL